MPSDTDRIGSATNGGGGGGNGLVGPPGLGGIGSPAKAPGAAHPPPELVKYGELIILGYNGQLPQGETTLGFRGARRALAFPIFGATKTSAFSIKVCISCSLRYPAGTSAPSSPHLTVSFFLCSSEATYTSRLWALEGHHVSSKNPSRVRDLDWGIAVGTKDNSVSPSRGPKSDFLPLFECLAPPLLGFHQVFYLVACN